MAHLFQSIKALFMPSTTVLGCALFLAINASSVWGGVFPFLPMEFQTRKIILEFFIAESLTFAISFIASWIGAYFLPQGAKNFLVKPISVLYALGWICLIAAMYVDAHADVLVIYGGVFLGLGSAGFYMLWQRLFSSQQPETGIQELVLSAVYAAVIYVALYLIPVAVTALLIPLVFLPLFALSITLKSRDIDLAQPMFDDVPFEHPKVYIHVLKDFWRSALAVGALGFCAGVVRSLALADISLGTLVNVMSFAGMMLAAIVLLVGWRTRNIRLNVIKIYRIAFPFIITAFLILPLVKGSYIHIMAAVLYAVYSAALLLMMIQCAQISRYRGVNPVFVYGFFGAIVYILHDIGFLGGMAAESVRVLGVSTTGLVALVSIYLLAFIYFLGAGGGFGNKDKRLADIEFIALNGQGRKTGEGPRLHRKKLDTPEEILPCGAVARTCESCASSALHAAEESGNAGANSTHSYMSIDLTAEENENIQKGKFKRKIEILQQDYGLTAREAEIMELIVRGNTVARIADILVISENTVRTHSKRLYTKLDVHKKQEIVDLLDGIYVE